MASFIFKRETPYGEQNKFSIKESRLGEGLPRKQRSTAKEMTTLSPANYRFPDRPVGLDMRVPLLPGDNTQK